MHMRVGGQLPLVLKLGARLWLSDGDEEVIRLLVDERRRVEHDEAGGQHPYSGRELWSAFSGTKLE